MSETVERNNFGRPKVHHCDTWVRRDVIAMLATLPTESPGVEFEAIIRDMRRLGLDEEIDFLGLVKQARLAGAAIYVDASFRVCWSPTQDQREKVDRLFTVFFSQ